MGEPLTIRDRVWSITSPKPIPAAAKPDGWPDEPLFIRRLTVTERDAVNNWVTSHTAPGRLGSDYPPEFRAFVLVRALGDADGKRLFGDDDVERFGALPEDAAYTALLNQALDVNNLGDNEGGND